jgi:hypothetical protein
MTKIKHHIYGECLFNVKVIKETDCLRCIHKKVCNFDCEKRCANYHLGRSGEVGCTGCIHRFTRFDDEEKILCFICNDFMLNAIEKELTVRIPPKKRYFIKGKIKSVKKAVPKIVI